jgi:hypothetical protein
VQGCFGTWNYGWILSYGTTNCRSSPQPYSVDLTAAHPTTLSPDGIVTTSNTITTVQTVISTASSRSPGLSFGQNLALQAFSHPRRVAAFFVRAQQLRHFSRLPASQQSALGFCHVTTVDRPIASTASRALNLRTDTSQISFLHNLSDLWSKTPIDCTRRK